ncbi:M48 family metallopeptidase [Ruegeria atlantica]|uniref:M48 family metallopeptidase n=1 Tax=Ruegeria atlantica TaxID=81569 RepID=UPI00147E9234|nr:M48 family metallopeptidase [Ruegeria atlantica]
MHRLICLFLPLLLAACSAGETRLQPATEWLGNTGEYQVEAAEVRDLSRSIGREARNECLRRAKVRNCDFTVLVDLNPQAEANAFQTLDDKGQPVIIMTRSMIQSVQNPDELAFVLGHETAHHLLRHIPRQAENAQESAAIFSNLGKLFGEEGEDLERTQKIGAEVGVQLNVKTFELEADQLGTILTHNAGYDPLIGAKYFDRIPDPEDSFLSSHPPNAQRVQMVQDTARKLGLTQ